MLLSDVSETLSLGFCFVLYTPVSQKKSGLDRNTPEFLSISVSLVATSGKKKKRKLKGEGIEAHWYLDV